MRTIDYCKKITESLEDLEKLYKSLEKKKQLERCEILIWLKSGKLKTMQEAASLKGRSKDYGNRLWRKYKKGGLNECLSLHYVARKSPLADKTELKDRLSNEGFLTVNEARKWIFEKYGIVYTENGLGNFFRHKKIKLKTARPHHPKQDELKREVYKKNLNRN